jgi:biotin-dependent carboxylase-like uncharacterized protein
MKRFRVHTPGAYTTVQDAGRFGLQKMGVPVSGALDQFAFTVANRLVGNPEDCAVLEITLTGPRLEFLNQTDVAVTGAEMELRLNGTQLGTWRSHRVQPGDVLDIHQVTSGCRAYLSVGGGIDVPLIMGSRSTYVGGKLGGFEGRALMAGDVLSGRPAPMLSRPNRLPDKWVPRYGREVLLRVVPGPQDDFYDEGMKTLLSSDYMVTPKADRMGYRLMGNAIQRKPHAPASIVSEPSMPGSIQVPADAQPIVLLVEQTVGGYSKIATVITPDLSGLTQCTPGDTVRFEALALNAAHHVYRDYQGVLNEILNLFY